MAGEGVCSSQLALELPDGDVGWRGHRRLLPWEGAFSLPQLPLRRVGAASRETIRSPTQKIYSSGAPYKVSNGFNEA